MASSIFVAGPVLVWMAERTQASTAVTPWYP